MASSAQDLAGSPTPPAAVRLERGPVSNFATAVTDENPVYHDPSVAGEHGFDDIPVPPTFPFSWNHWGAFPEIQPGGASDQSPVMHAVGALMASGGLILHGEQEFVYHRTPVVGEALRSEGVVKDVYEKEGGSKMTFVVMETDWYDEDDEKVVTVVMTLIHKA